MHRKAVLVTLALLAVAVMGVRAQTATSIDIPYQQFTLDNGLKVIVHEDHKAPIVAVNIWYHVGSKNEPNGRSGFAHLFEHLMFNGSENFNDDYFKVLEKVGATDLNGTTSEDRTNYFQNVPTSALDVALWMESDRMGHLLGAITQEKLDEQRGVVQNEKRQGENEPYGMAWDHIQHAMYETDHPYGHTVIGSMDDLNAASLDDVKNWFKTYYGPNNAVLVLAGDIDLKTAREKAQKYFGDIPPGPPVTKFKAWPAKRTGEQRMVMQDRVPQSRVYMVWNVPELTSKVADQLNLVASVLSNGKSSRLYKRLVYDDQIATDVSAFVAGSEIASGFMVIATARPDGDLKQVETVVREELTRLLKEGPTEEELTRAKTRELAGFVRGIERIGGFGGKSDILAQHAVYYGSPDAYKQSLLNQEQATTSDLKKVANDWLTDGLFVLEVSPFEEGTPATAGSDRSAVPDAGAAPDARFPELQRTTLSNGMNVILAERKAIPVVNFRMVFDAGYASDQFASEGVASLAMNMLDEGTRSRNSLEINDELGSLGAYLSTGSNLDLSYVNLSALKANLEPSLDLYADVILNPSFPQTDLDRLKKEQIARIQREKVTPLQMAMRVFPRLLYGENHAYGNPLTGSGTEAAVAAVQRDALVKFQQTWFKPNNATVVVVGDITMNELKPLLEKRFGSWKKGDVPRKNLAEVKHQPRQKIYLVDRPGSQQSVVFVGHVAPPPNANDMVATDMMNELLGGAFTSRINMNLREDKHWSYGAFSFLMGARGQRPFIAYSPVQTDKTKESMQEMARELRGILTDRPATQEELDRVQQNNLLGVAGRWETGDAVAGSIIEQLQYNLPDDFYAGYSNRVAGLKLPMINQAAKNIVHPDNLIWVIVGDRAVIESGIRELGFGEIEYLDGDGAPLTASN